MSSTVGFGAVTQTACNPSLRATETYVMKGSSEKKSLDTYHLILASSFACNLRCNHCYLPDHKMAGLSKEDVLGLVDEWSEIVMAERGPMGGIFHLKGGEPLALPYLNDVLDRLEELKTMRFMMTTNGTLGDEDVIQRLGRLNVALDGGAQIIVSIDGSNDEINAQLRGSGNFAKSVDFVRKLREAGITVFLNNVIHRGNMGDIEAFVNLAVELDVQQINFLSFVPKGQGEEMRFGRPDSRIVFQEIDSIWKRGDEHVRNLLAGSLSDILHAESCGTCTSGECVGGYRGLLYIVPDGTAFSCPNLNFKGLEAGNMHKDKLANIHNALHEKVYSKVATAKGDNIDRYKCKGEKYLPGASDDVNETFTNAQNSQVVVPHNSNDDTSYCFSRNF